MAGRSQRIGLIADIHGNLIALDAVLTALDSANVDQIVCLGDLAALGPNPSGVIKRLHEREIPCVMGNTDAWLIPDSPIAAEPATTAPVAGLTRWCADQLSAADRTYLQSLPLTRRIAVADERTLLAFHASPRSLDEIIAATTDADQLDAVLAGHEATVFAGGHTHIPLLRRHRDTRLINPGSVGLPGVGPGGPDLPINTAVAWAEYAILTADQDTIGIEFQQVSLDVEAMINGAKEREMPQLDWWRGRWAFDAESPES